jgi:hypothetical protein
MGAREGGAEEESEGFVHFIVWLGLLLFGLICMYSTEYFVASAGIAKREKETQDNLLQASKNLLWD